MSTPTERLDKLDDKKKELEYERLHTIKKKEWEGRVKYDGQGRPRCK